MTPLAIALSLLAAFSAPDYTTLQAQIAVYQGTPVKAGWLSDYDNTRHVIVVSDAVQHPVLIGVLLAHEASNAQGNWDGDLSHCVANESRAQLEGQKFMTWFTATFGPPQFTTAGEWSINAGVWQAPLTEALTACGQAIP